MSARVEETARLSVAEAAHVLGRALRYVAPFRRRFAAKLALTIGAALTILLLPWPAKIIIDHVVMGIPVEGAVETYPFFARPFVRWLAGASIDAILGWTIAAQGLLLVAIGAFGGAARESHDVEGYLATGQDTATETENEANAGFTLVGGLYGLFEFGFTVRLTQAFNHHYRSRLFERIQSLPMAAFDDERIGDAVYRVMYDTPAITNACYRLLLTPIGSAVFILATAWVLSMTFGNHPLLIWSALSFAPLALAVTYPFAGILRGAAGESRQAGATTTATVDEGMSNILAVQSMGGEGRERRRFDRDSAASFRRFRIYRLIGMAAFLAASVPVIFVAGRAWLYVADLAIEGAITVGDFTLLLTYFVGLVVAAVGLGSLWVQVQNSAAGLNRVFFLMDQPAEVDAPAAQTLQPISQGVRIENVSLSYADGTRALSEVSAELPIGAVTAVVGPAGAGKTSLAYLVPRFLEPQKGRVSIDGTDVAALARHSLRSQIGFVFQETVLFDDTVEGNIRVGRPEATDLQVRRAARVAGADEFIAQLPDGYGTALGRSGGKLSVGQKQRLAIARALLRDGAILILDEPTSALDPESERRLLAALREVGRKRVVLVIAHRLSTVRDADQILFLDGGRIVERGTHAELVARPQGAYRRFWELQNRGAA